MEQEILEATKAYLNYDADLNEVPEDDFLLLLIDRVIGEYKEQRNYPDGTSDEVIDADVEKYFSKKKGYVACEVIPAMIGKIGSEGMYTLIDNQVTKNWKNPIPVYLPDVVPYGKVV